MELMAVVPTQLNLSRELIRMMRQLHLAQPTVRQRALLSELCRLFEAKQGQIQVMGIDPATGMSRVMHSFTVSGPMLHNGADSPNATAPKSAARKKSPTSRAVQNGEGPVHEAFVPLEGVRRMARLSLVREPGRRRFTPAERGLIDLIHAECAWVYDGAEHDTQSA